MRFTAPTLSKAVLEVAENVVTVEVVYDRAVDNMFEELACYAGEGDGPIILNVRFFGFFEKGDDVGNFPVIWNSSSVKGLLKN